MSARCHCIADCARAGRCRSCAGSGSSADTPYETAAPFLPRSLGEALQSLRENKTLRGAFGGGFIDYFIHIKEAELARFEQEVSEWERREYFDLF